MRSIKHEMNYTIEIKKSKFICYLKNVNSEEDAKEYVEQIKQEHPTARHHCVAYRIGSHERANDDGEPSGTAALPMLNVLQHHDMVNTIAVTVRYFGGIKLGAGGLVRAYSDSVAQALLNAEVANLKPGYKLQVKAGYSDTKKIEHIFQSNNITPQSVNYEANVIYNLELEQELANNLIQELQGYNHMIKVDIQREITVVV